MSDEGDAADDAARDSGETEEADGRGGRTALVTKPVTRPQRPTGKRSRQKAADSDVDDKESSAEVLDETDVEGDKKKTKKSAKAGKAGKSKSAQKSARVKKSKKAGASSANPIIFVYNYLKQVVGEMRKVIWPNRKQMLTYTSVVLVFLAFMVALVGLADLGLGRLVMLVFG